MVLNGRMDLFYWKASPSVQPSKGGSCSCTTEKMQHVIICCSFCLGTMAMLESIAFPFTSDWGKAGIERAYVTAL